MASTQAIAKKQAELEHLQKEHKDLKEAMDPQEASKLLIQYMRNKVDPFNDPENPWVHEGRGGCQNCVIL